MKTQLFIPEKWSQTNMEELSYNYYDKWIIEKNEKTIEDILDDLPIEVIEKYLSYQSNLLLHFNEYINERE